jgi:hypothetical protein
LGAAPERSLVAGAKTGEAAVIVTTAGGQRVSLLVADALQNNAKETVGFLPRLMGFAGGPKVVPVKTRQRSSVSCPSGPSCRARARAMFCPGDSVTDGAAAALKSAAAPL